MPDTVSPAAQALDGKTTVDDKMVFEPERLSYLSAVDLAARIAAAIPGDNAAERPVVIAGVPFLSDLANLVAIGTLLDTLAEDYQSLGEQADHLREKRLPQTGADTDVVTLRAANVMSVLPPFAPVAAVAAGLNTAIGIVSLFREDVSFSGVRTGVDSLAFEIAVAGELKKRGFATVLIPDLFVVPTHDAVKDSLRGRLQAIERAKLKLWQTITPIVSELVDLDTQLDQASRDSRQPDVDRLSGEIAVLRRDLSPITEPLSKADQRLSEILAQLQHVDPAGMTGLARLLRAEAIRARTPAFLHLKVVSSGGHNRTSRSLLRTLFAGDGLSFMGGLVARWALLNEKGEVENGGVLTGRQAGRFPPLGFWSS